MIARAIAVGFVTLALSACVAPREPARAAAAIGFLAFGDTGYHEDYIEADDISPTPAAYVENEHAEWIEDNRPAAEFAYPPMQALAAGGYAPASGLAPVASAMRGYCTELARSTRNPRACAFATMLGDNVYPDGLTLGADGRSDADRLRKLFVEPFGSLREGDPDFRVYVALGNHDWHTSRESAMAQQRFAQSTPPFYMDGLFYRVSPPAAAGLVELFVIDTNLLLAAVAVHEGAVSDEGNEIVFRELEERGEWELPSTQAEREMAAWLEQALASSTASWKIVIGHHPLWSSAGSKFEQARVLRGLILPALCRHADLYLAGHEHTLEAHRQECAAIPGAKTRPLLSVVSGAGAKQRPLNTRFAARQAEIYADHDPLWAQGLVWGFAHVALEQERGTLRLVSTPDDSSGTPVVTFTHEFERRSGVRAPPASQGSP